MARCKLCLIIEIGAKIEFFIRLVYADKHSLILSALRGALVNIFKYDGYLHHYH